MSNSPWIAGIIFCLPWVWLSKQMIVHPFGEKLGLSLPYVLAMVLQGSSFWRPGLFFSHWVPGLNTDSGSGTRQQITWPLDLLALILITRLAISTLGTLYTISHLYSSLQVRPFWLSFQPHCSLWKLYLSCFWWLSAAIYYFGILSFPLPSRSSVWKCRGSYHCANSSFLR